MFSKNSPNCYIRLLSTASVLGAISFVSGVLPAQAEGNIAGWNSVKSTASTRSTTLKQLDVFNSEEGVVDEGTVLDEEGMFEDNEPFDSDPGIVDDNEAMDSNEGLIEEDSFEEDTIGDEDGIDSGTYDGGEGIYNDEEVEPSF